MSNRKAYLVHFLAILILSVSYFTRPSLAAPALQRREDGDGSLLSSDLTDAADSFQKVVDNTTSTTPLAITPTPMQDSPNDGPTTTTTTSPTTQTSSAVSSSVTPTPTRTITQVELVPPVTVIKQLGTTAVVVASLGKTTTIKITASGTSGLPSPTGSSSNQVTSAGVALRISSSMIAVGFAIAVWIVVEIGTSGVRNSPK